MLRVAIGRVRPEAVDELREWLHTVNGDRRDEALATLADEGCRHEQAFLVENGEDLLLVYAMEVEDIDKTHQAFQASTHPIDAEHRAVMECTVGEPLPIEPLLDLYP